MNDPLLRAWNGRCPGVRKRPSRTTALLALLVVLSAGALAVFFLRSAAGVRPSTNAPLPQNESDHDSLVSAEGTPEAAVARAAESIPRTPQVNSDSVIRLICRDAVTGDPVNAEISISAEADLSMLGGGVFEISALQEQNHSFGHAGGTIRATARNYHPQELALSDLSAFATTPFEIELRPRLQASVRFVEHVDQGSRPAEGGLCGPAPTTSLKQLLVGLKAATAAASDEDGLVVRPDVFSPRVLRWRAAGGLSARCVELAGESPVLVIAGEPGSRPRAAREISPSERGVESPSSCVRSSGGEQSCGPSLKRTLQPRDISPRKGGEGRADHVTAKATDCDRRSGGSQDPPGVRRRARSESSARNRRDPRWRPTLGEGDAYKRNVKSRRARALLWSRLTLKERMRACREGQQPHRQSPTPSAQALHGCQVQPEATFPRSV